MQGCQASNHAPRPRAARDRSRQEATTLRGDYPAPGVIGDGIPLAADRSPQHRGLRRYGPAGISVVLSTSTARAGPPGASAYTPRLVYTAAEVLE